MNKLVGVGGHLILLAFEDTTARKRLEQQKDALLGLASHGLKTPITGAKLQVQLLHRRLMKTGDKRSASQLEQVDVYLNRLTHLIDGLLDRATIETGTLSLCQEGFAVDDLIREICEELQYTCPDRRIICVQEAHAQVYGDRWRTGEVHRNLVDQRYQICSVSATD